jgi:hypothetical protein
MEETPVEEKEFSNEHIRHLFSEEELLEISSEMAQQVTSLKGFEDDKKALTSDFNGKIDSAKAQINSAATKLNNGYEYRTIKCEVERDYDAKVVRFYRIDTGELAKERPMTADELQLRLVK